jgi:hypothetical protein
MADPHPGLDGPVLLLERLALLVAVTWPAVGVLTGAAEPDTRTLALLAALAGAVAVALVGPAAPARWAPAPRLGAAGVAVIASAGLSGDTALPGLWPLGVAAGCDLCRAAWAAGTGVRPARWTRAVLLSPATAGALLALGTFAAVGDAATGRRVLWLALALVLGAAAAVGVAAALDRCRRAVERSWAARERAVVVREHRSRGHWLHDDVCAELRLLRLRLEGGGLDLGAALAELDELDHRLRLRRLDEFLVAGPVRLAEVVQPYLRRARQLEVAVVESPTVEDAGVVVDPGTARAVRRAVSVLVANAVQAGTPTLAFRLDVAGGRIAVEVEDEAGGFDLDLAPAGRGLDGLRHELGPGALTSVRTERGTRVRAVVARRPRPA